jgi:hypothetical protein
MTAISADSDTERSKRNLQKKSAWLFRCKSRDMFNRDSRCELRRRHKGDHEGTRRPLYAPPHWISWAPACELHRPSVFERLRDIIIEIRYR